MRLRRAAKPPTFDLSLAARTRHAWLARLTRARGRRYIRGRKALLNDFCRAFGHSKAREKKKLLYVSSRANNVRPPSRRRRPSLLRKSVNPPSWRRRPSLLRKSVNPPRLDDADRVCFANRSIPPSSHIPKTALNFYAKSRSANLF